MERLLDVATLVIGLNVQILSFRGLGLLVFNIKIISTCAIFIIFAYCLLETLVFAIQNPPEK